MWILQSTGLSHVSVVKVLETDIGSSKIRLGLGEGKGHHKKRSGSWRVAF